MKLIPYNWRFRNLVSLIHFVVGAGCGLVLKAITPFPSAVGWTLVAVATVILFVLFNYRIVFANGDKEQHPERTSSQHSGSV
jgi:uncharacterized membrane protein YoaK (UPF0700 family)